MSDEPVEVTLSRRQLQQVGEFCAKEVARQIKGTAWMSSQQTCDYLSVDLDWLYDRVSKGAIPHVKIGRLLRFKRSEMDLWMETFRREP